MDPKTNLPVLFTTIEVGVQVADAAGAVGQLDRPAVDVDGADGAAAAFNAWLPFVIRSNPAPVLFRTVVGPPLKVALVVVSSNPLGTSMIDGLAAVPAIVIAFGITRVASTVSVAPPPIVSVPVPIGLLVIVPVAYPPLVVVLDVTGSRA